MPSDDDGFRYMFLLFPGNDRASWSGLDEIYGNLLLLRAGADPSAKHGQGCEVPFYHIIS